MLTFNLESLMNSHTSSREGIFSFENFSPIQLPASKSLISLCKISLIVWFCCFYFVNTVSNSIFYRLLFYNWVYVFFNCSLISCKLFSLISMALSNLWFCSCCSFNCILSCLLFDLNSRLYVYFCNCCCIFFN